MFQGIQRKISPCNRNLHHKMAETSAKLRYLVMKTVAKETHPWSKYSQILNL